MREYIALINKNGITPAIVSQMIDDHKDEHDKTLDLYDRYKASVKGVPILTRNAIDYATADFETDRITRIDNKVNNRINNAFDADIVDTKVGYLFGHPIGYKAEQESLQTLVSDFNTRSDAEDADSELGKKAAICGYGARLLYIDTDGKERIANVDPWEAILLSETDITEPTYALRYYTVYDWDNGSKIKKIRAEFYDAEHYTIYESSDDATFTLLDTKVHTFGYCPLFGVPNNEETKGDAEKVLELIDAYDRTLSDVNNEIEQYRLAYLVLKGVGVDAEILKELKQSGVMSFMEPEDDAFYLTKNVNDGLIENHLGRLEDNILRFAKSVNFNDEAFAGNIAGVAMKFKLLALENKSVTMERKMTAALRYQFKVLCSAWQKRGLAQADDYLTLTFAFKRNLPVNVLDEAQSTATLRGNVSEETRLSLLSFVDDVQDELNRMEDEALRFAPPVDDEEANESEEDVGNGSSESE